VTHAGKDDGIEVEHWPRSRAGVRNCRGWPGKCGGPGN
jgi:hypothetical protein